MNRSWRAKRQGSIYFSWIISYILVVAVCISVSGIAYVQSLKDVEEEVGRSDEAMLRQVQLTIDGYMRDIVGLSSTVALNKKAEIFMRRERPFNETEWFEIFEIVKDLKGLGVVNSFIENFYVYYLNSDLAVTPDGSYTGLNLYNSIHKSEAFTYEEWHTMMMESHNNHFLSITKRNAQNEEKKSIAFAQTLPMNNLAHPSAIVVILVDEKRLQEIIRNMQVESIETVMAIDRLDNVIWANSSENMPLQVAYHELDGAGGRLYKMLNGTKYVVSYSRSLVNDWVYLSILPHEVVYKKVTNTRNLIILCIAISLLLGAGLTFFFSRKNYNPMREMIQSVSTRSGKKYNKRGLNEYRYIQETLVHAFDEKDEIVRKLEQQNQLFRSNFLSRLIKGKVGNKVSLHDTLSSFNVRFQFEHFAVIVFLFEDYAGFLSQDGEEDIEEEVRLMQFILTNVVEEMVGRKYTGYMTEIDEMMVCIVNFAEADIPTIQESLLHIADEAQQFFKTQFHIYTTVAVSGFHETLTGISAAYQEALEALEYKIVMGASSILAYNDIAVSEDMKKRNYDYNLETEQKFINLVKAGEFDSAAALLNEVFERSLSKGLLPLPLIKCMMFDLTSTLIKTMDELEDNTERLLEKTKLVEMLLKCETISEMKVLMLNSLREFCDLVHQRKKSHNVRLKEDVKRYITEHYHDVELSLLVVASKFDKNPVYLSRFFKEQTGESMLDYINRIRLEKSKEMLRDREINIVEIATKIGYYNSNTFTRSFKKYEGITPKQYREMNKS